MRSAIPAAPSGDSTMMSRTMIPITVLNLASVIPI
jgi:hypothetical protein